jgi:PAS domain S-box-containing protein
MSAGDPLEGQVQDLERRNRLLEERLAQAERIRREWSEAVTKLREARRREKAHLAELQRTHAELAASQRFVEGITRCMGEGIYALDEDGRLTFLNPEAEQTLGWTLDEAGGRDMHALIHSHRPDGSEVPAETCPVLHTIASGEVYRTQEDWFEHRDGHLIPVAYVAAPLLENGRVAGSVTVFQDITERKAMEAQLVRSEKLAGLAGMVAGVAHEINTPVGVAVTAASTLEERARTVHAALEAGQLKKSMLLDFLAGTGESTHILLANLNRAAELVRSFKMVSADQTSEARSRFRLGEYLQSVLLTLHPKLKKTPHQVSLDCPPDLEMESYPGALSQVATNLVMNSLQHAYGPEDTGHMTIQANATDERVRIVYTDDGRGIPAERREQVFEPFFTTRRGEGNSGLGMHIVHNLVVQSLGGTLTLDERPGGGVRFTLDLPRWGAEDRR